MNKTAPTAAALAWWQADVLVIFGISVPILPMLFALVALWCGREIARDNRRKWTSRETVFLNIGLVLVTFLAVTGKLLGSDPLELGWATVLGFGIGMNGPVIFEIFQRFTYAIFSTTFRQRGDDNSAQ